MRKLVLRLQFVITAALALGGCSGRGGPELEEEAVTRIPEGDAVGDAATGTYEVEVRTVACEGDCAVATELVPLSFCDVGDVDQETIVVVQRDGILEVEWDEPLSTLTGGIYKNGGYDVGGYGTEFGGRVDITARVAGTIQGDGLSGDAQSRAVGEVDGDEVDCLGSHEVNGTKESSESE